MIVAIFVISVALGTETEGKFRVGDVGAAADGAFVTIHLFFGTSGGSRSAGGAGFIPEAFGGSTVVRFAFHIFYSDPFHTLGCKEEDHKV